MRSKPKLIISKRKITTGDPLHVADQPTGQLVDRKSGLAGRSELLSLFVMGLSIALIISYL